MGNVIPFYRKFHVLFVENDWVIRQILTEHFAHDPNCHMVSFANPEKAVSYLHQGCGANRIFSNIHLGESSGIDLSSGFDWKYRIELAIAPGYDAEEDRFRAIEAGRGFFRVKPYRYYELLHLVHHTMSHSSSQ
ncbi:MAG: response regulator [Desulfobacteraceae bacterium]|nr:response regulator [Desulfobacteraceae bacterium]MBC2753670.1 response regulator [Desulfobacteraceae bacterium]